MVAINFTVFQDKILDGSKRQTIRRTARCKPGDRLQLYTGMRTKSCRKLGEAVCVNVLTVIIKRSYTSVGYHRLSNREEASLAKRDGFASVADMIGFFEKHYGIPFEGEMIVWRDFQPAEQSL